RVRRAWGPLPRAARAADEGRTGSRRAAAPFPRGVVVRGAAAPPRGGASSRRDAARARSAPPIRARSARVRAQGEEAHDPRPPARALALDDHSLERTDHARGAGRNELLPLTVAAEGFAHLDAGDLLRGALVVADHLVAG